MCPKTNSETLCNDVAGCCEVNGVRAVLYDCISHFV
jgi:hypothetical protein